jgi:endonuclease YncB( thermonuclease family)
MLVIAGRYRIRGAQPDGDSVRFYPDDPAQWRLLPGPHRVRPNAAGGAQVRLDGVDALETHYPSAGLGIVHQPLPHGRSAAAALLDGLGFTGVVRATDETVTASDRDALPGHIFTRSADANGRCVAFAFTGAPPAPSGQEVFVGPDMLRQSLNLRLLADGLVYPTYYTKLFPDLREEMTAAAVAARRAGAGLWPSDATTAGFRVSGIASLTEDAVALPKLFRRLADYLALNDGSADLAGFPDYLEARDDRLFVLSTGHATGFDFVVRVEGQRLRLTTPPEDLVFVEA